MAKKARLEVQLLEDRINPSPLGQAWPDPNHLTLSFAPDGTTLNGAPSVLFQDLNAVASTSQWEQVFLNAFQTWAAQTNVNITQVADGGQPFGTDGAAQGDPRFGDIRIGMEALPANLVATTAPFSWSGSTWSGDIILNSAYSFGINGAGQYDLYSVALHESGHALGLLDNTNDPASAMFANYTGPRSGLDANDVADIQSLYGVHVPGVHTSGSNSNGSNVLNNTLATAVPLSAPWGNTSDLRFNGLAKATIVAQGQVDYYQIAAPTATPASGGYALDVMAWQTTPGALAPAVHVFDANGNPLAVQALGTNGSVDAVQVVNAAPGALFYIAVTAQSSAAAANGTGGYELGVKFNQQTQSAGPVLGSDTLASSSATDTGSLTMDQNGAFAFQLNVANGSSTVCSTVTMTVCDQNGNVLLTLSATTGTGPRSEAVYLVAGVYTIRYGVSSTTGGSYVPTTYWLSGAVLSDPLGPFYTGSSSGLSISVTTPTGTVQVPIPAVGGSWSQTFTTSQGTTTLTLTTDLTGVTTLILTTWQGDAVTENVTTVGAITMETISTSDGITITISCPVTAALPTYSGANQAGSPPYSY